MSSGKEWLCPTTLSVCRVRARSDPPPEGLGFYVRAGHNDHVALLDLLVTGESGVFGLVIDAQHVDRHRDLITEARRRDLDVILDPKILQMGFPGAMTEGLAALPWGLARHHNVADFDGSAGQQRVVQIVEAAVSNGVTQLLGPTHLLSSANDPWLRRDITMMIRTADEIARSGMAKELDLIYPLAVPMALLRNAAERRAIIAAIADAPCAAIWLKVENFGDDSTGEKVAAYIEACRDFHARGIPLVGDQVGGLPGLGVLAFGAVGGIAHGVTMQQSFRASGWRRPAVEGGGFGLGWRVYIPQLDLLLKAKLTQALFAASPKIKAMCGCRDTHCCPHGVGDMLDHPARHAVYQRAREIEHLSVVPQSVRAGHYLNQNVRKVSDDVAQVAAFPVGDDALTKRLQGKQREMSRYRQTIAHLVENGEVPSVAVAPSRRQARKGG
jgi:hypothetical protein